MTTTHPDTPTAYPNPVKQTFRLDGLLKTCPHLHYRQIIIDGRSRKQEDKMQTLQINGVTTKGRNPKPNIRSTPYMKKSFFKR